jgi:hypothetical protein
MKEMVGVALESDWMMGWQVAWEVD